MAAAAALVILAWWAPGEADVSSGCVSNPLPASPASPSAALDTVNFGEGMHVDVWRQRCLDGSGSALLMRVAPTTASPFLCSGDFTLLQNGLRYNALLLPAPASPRLCADLAGATTVILDAAAGPAIAFDNRQAFTLVFSGWDNGAPRIAQGNLSSEVIVPATIAAAVLPGSRSVPLGTSATAFATVIASGTDAATQCGIVPATSLPVSFEFRTTDPATNAVTGGPNVPATIPPGGAQTFMFAITPSAPFPTTNVELTFHCASTPPAPIIQGVNTFLLSADTDAVPDIIALAATLTGDGIVNLQGADGTGAFAVATANVGGAGGPITVSADTGDAIIPMSLAVCSTDAAGSCLSPPSPTVTVQINPRQTPTFAVFVTGSGTVPFDPGANRVFVRFTDAGDVTRGATSVAVRTQ